jgi:hypothetical protein
MSEKEQVYEEIAMRQDALYDYRRSSVIFVMIFDDDMQRLQRYKTVLSLGTILNEPERWSAAGDIRAPINKVRGKHAISIRGQEAYQFCLDILPHLAEHDGYRHTFCQRCITRHENNQNG